MEQGRLRRIRIHLPLNLHLQKGMGGVSTWSKATWHLQLALEPPGLVLAQKACLGFDCDSLAWPDFAADFYGVDVRPGETQALSTQPAHDQTWHGITSEHQNFGHVQVLGCVPKYLGILAWFTLDLLGPCSAGDAHGTRSSHCASTSLLGSCVEFCNRAIEEPRGLDTCLKAASQMAQVILGLTETQQCIQQHM